MLNCKRRSVENSHCALLQNYYTVKTFERYLFHKPSVPLENKQILTSNFATVYSLIGKFKPGKTISSLFKH